MNSITDSQEVFNERSGPHGVARKYWDVPMELFDDAIGISIGSVFVLGQAAIEQSVSIVEQIRKISNSPAIPDKKWMLLESADQLSPNTQLSSIVVIDTAANYFKHHHGWPDDWHITMSGTGTQMKTMENARRIGMSGLELTPNMHRALSAISLGPHNVFSIPMSVHDWRVELAKKFSAILKINVE